METSIPFSLKDFVYFTDKIVKSNEFLFTYLVLLTCPLLHLPLFGSKLSHLKKI